MKKLILFLAVIFSAIVLQAQTINGVAAFPKDSTTNTQTKYLKIASAVAITANYVGGIYIVPVAKTATQTVSAILQGSIDNSVFFDVTNATADSVKLNTAGTVKLYGWVLNDTHWKYYRIKAVGYNTGVTTFTGGFILKRKQ